MNTFVLLRNLFQEPFYNPTPFKPKQQLHNPHNPVITRTQSQAVKQVLEFYILEPLEERL